ncbi:hypothetical protein [Chelativorans xinjiangense]|uniref:hypothetical protein n=1 Tax=Chelativorans xinjiangense TaxID=2681485 RepID=UPI0013574F8F|nr:hypothetical protein [Chelativorans xinjiangense]
MPANEEVDIDLFDDGTIALLAVEELLCAAGVQQLNEVHAENLAMPLYVIRDHTEAGLGRGDMTSKAGLAGAVAEEVGDMIAKESQRRSRSFESDVR